MNLKRKIKEELNRTLLKEGCTYEQTVDHEYECNCEGTGQNSTCTGTLTTTRFADCSVWSSAPCTCCTSMVDRGGRGEPMGQTMAESRGYRSHRTRR